jgi:hypothetical protein
LDASGGSASLNLLGAAEGALIRAAASTQPFGGYRFSTVVVNNARSTTTMEEIQFHAPFWAYTLLVCTALGLLLSVPKFNGKGWLILFLVIRCVTQTSNYLPPLLLRYNIYTVDQYRAFFESWGLVFELLNAISYALIVAFALALKSAAGMHSGTGRLLFLFRGRVGRQGRRRRLPGRAVWLRPGR